MTTATPRQGPISPGNVVSAALRIYRDQFKIYFGLAAKAMLWLIVPILCGVIFAGIIVSVSGQTLMDQLSLSSLLRIVVLPSIVFFVPTVYGCAKYAMHTGLMSRMAYQTLINEPESVRQAYKQTNPKLWSYLLIGILLLIIFAAAYIVIGIGSAIVGSVTGFVLGSILSAVLGDAGAIIGSIIAGLLTFAAIIIGLLQVASRLFIAEVPISLEPELRSATESIGRSWNLTKGSIGRIQLVVLATYLVTLPVMLVTNILPQLILLRMDPTSPAFAFLNLVLIVVSIAASIAVLPFWQAAKGVLYYDLRSRREGADLEI